VALAFLVFYCGALVFAQVRARHMAELFAGGLASWREQQVQRVAATPVLADPFTWRCLAETDRSTIRFDMRLDAFFFEDLRNIVSFDKPASEDEEIVRRASQNEAARVLLDFARFPVARVQRADTGVWVVQFADLRFTEPGEGARVGGFALDVPVEAPVQR
jgi:hypothetical protein